MWVINAYIYLQCKLPCRANHNNSSPVPLGEVHLVEQFDRRNEESKGLPLSRSWLNPASRSLPSGTVLV
jgi:hypothetical protein